MADRPAQLPPSHTGFSKSHREYGKRGGRPPKSKPGTPLRELRQQHGLTLSDLHRLTGVYPATWSQIERGRLMPEPVHFEALAKAFDVPVGRWRVSFVIEAVA